jgi:hypothetical protein
MTDGHQSPLQEARSIITIAAILVAVMCYLSATKNAPVISPALFWLATQIYNWLPMLSRIPGEQIPMLVSSAAVGGGLWILGMPLAGPLAAWFSAGQLGRLERQTLKLKRNRARIQKRRRDRDQFDVT